MEKDYGKIKKNDNTDLIVRVDDFGGNPGLTIREFVTSERYTGFTKAGVRINSENFSKFKEMINSIDEKDFVVEETKEDEKKEEKKKKKPKNQAELPDY